MNITPQAPNLFTPTVLNPNTETLRRENHQREIITQPAALNQSAAEKGVASDKERGRTPAQNSESIDFASLKEKAEQANQAISGQKGEQGNEQNPQQQNANQEQTTKQDDSAETNQASEQDESNTEQVELAQAREISQLKHRDQEVKAHELAHATTGGSLTGPPTYTYETGPDGKRYAVAGEVSVDLSTVKGDPEATIAKMQKVHSAALAPANPSAQDAKIAANATQIILQAQSELLSSQSDESAVAKTNNDNASPTLAKDQQGSLNDSDQEQDFDTFINQTLEAQEQVSPTRSDDVIQRAGRIENFYQGITQAYNKPATYQFELTA